MADRERRNLIFAHQEWLGFVQPVGLVVAPTVMVDAQVVPDRNISGRQREFRALLDAKDETERRVEASGVAEAPATYRVSGAPSDSVPGRVFRDWLGWEDGDLVDAGVHRDTLEVSLPELQVVLAPTWAVPGDEDGNAEWTLLVRVEDGSADLDQAPDDGAGWNASRHARFERLLRETGVPAGLLCTDEQIRLVHAPRGESSGHITFELAQMALPAGRPILAAFDMLLSAEANMAGASFAAAAPGRRGSPLPPSLQGARPARAKLQLQRAATGPGRKARHGSPPASWREGKAGRGEGPGHGDIGLSALRRRRWLPPRR